MDHLLTPNSGDWHVLYMKEIQRGQNPGFDFPISGCVFSVIPVPKPGVRKTEVMKWHRPSAFTRKIRTI